MAKELLIDFTTFNVTPKMITESEQANNGKVIVQGVLQRAGAKNQNGRVYPKDILAREVKKYKEVQIAERRALGELDHPESSVVNLQNVSHNVLDDFELICWDFVSNPSTHGAFMAPVNEGVNKNVSEWDVCDQYCKTNSIIRDILGDL